MGSPIRKLSSRHSPSTFIDQCDEEGKPSPASNPFLPSLSFPAFLLKYSVSRMLAVRQKTYQALRITCVLFAISSSCFAFPFQQEGRKRKRRQEDRQLETPT
jgi:hypothetical protein